ncbi:MAG: DUF4831 family protein [Bacteroidota bacterium]|nr:DUF4831 family protein [Bacteroidota bacterium]
MLPKSALRPLVLMACLLWGSQLFAQLNVVHVGSGFNQGDYKGVYFTLPRTILKIDLVLDKVSKIQGPYSDYASKSLGLNNVIDRNITTYRLRSVNVSTLPEPDPQQVYFITRSEKASRGEESLLLSLTGSGVFLGADITKLEEEQYIGFVTTDHSIDPDSIERYFQFLAERNQGIKIDTITRKITIDTTTIYRHTYKRRLVEKSVDQKVKEALEQIENIRANRFNILTGYQEVAYSKEAMQYMVDQLDKMEQEYLDLFRGKIIHQTVNYSYQYVPGTEDAREEWVPVFGLSERSGFQGLKEANDELFYVQMKGTGVSQFSGTPTVGQGRSLEGLPYRIPERVMISVKYKGKVHEVMRGDIAQFGNVAVLPVGTTKMNLYPLTGGIKSVLIEY